MQNSGIEPSEEPVDVLVIDDEESIREGCRQVLATAGYLTEVAEDGILGLQAAERARPPVVLLDLRMPGVSGIEVLEKLRGMDPQIVPIIITGYGSVDNAVQSMKLGAFDFVSKPFDPATLLAVVNRAIERHKELQVPPAQIEPRPEIRPAERVEEPDVLLKGLETLGQSYSLGMEGHTLPEQVQALEHEAEYHAKQLGTIRQKGRAIADLLADLRMVDEIVQKHGFKRNALIQVMLDAQMRKHWLPRHALMWISRRLNVPLARVYEIATFYEAFSLVPQGAHTVQVCQGTACHVRGAPQLASSISALLGIKNGETDSRLLFTLKEVHCVGCCAVAPVVKIDDTYHGNPSLKQLGTIFRSVEEKEQVRSCQSSPHRGH
jgi:NADH-quinone oxidoreductase subunit E